MLGVATFAALSHPLVLPRARATLQFDPVASLRPRRSQPGIRMWAQPCHCTDHVSALLSPQRVHTPLAGLRIDSVGGQQQRLI